MHKHDIKPLSYHDYVKVVAYFYNLTQDDYIRMGIDYQNLPSREKWITLLTNDAEKPLTTRQFYYVAWILDNELVGHCGINNIKYSEEACIHLHIWNPELRKKGLSFIYFLKSVKFYFEHFSLQKIICEPNVANPGPNRILARAGFILISSYKTKPSMINFEHVVNRYELCRTEFQKLFTV